MSVESDLFDTLKGLVSNKAYPLVAPANTVGDRIVYQKNSDVPDNHQRGTSITNIRWQVRAISETYAGAVTLESAIRDAMKTAPFGSTLLLALDDFDDETRLYSRIMHFSCWINR